MDIENKKKIITTPFSDSRPTANDLYIWQMTTPHQLISTGHNTNEQCQSTEGRAVKKHYKSMKVTHMNLICLDILSEYITFHQQYAV